MADDQHQRCKKKFSDRRKKESVSNEEEGNRNKELLTGHEKLKKKGTMYPGFWIVSFPRTGVVNSPNVHGLLTSILC